MNKQASELIEPRPALLQFRHGHQSGTIYTHRVGGRIIEAYRGYSFSYTPIAPAVRSDSAVPTKR